MRQHLEAGCQQCVRQAENWRAILKFTRDEQLVTPVQSAVERAEKLFAPFAANASRSRSQVSVAELVFDSFLQVQVGVRGAGSVPRQLLYKCGTICIEMQLEPNLSSRRVELLGQVLDDSESLQKLDDLPVSILSQGDTISKTTTNQFGEFHLGFTPIHQPHLVVGIEKGNLVLPLPETEMRS